MFINEIEHKVGLTKKAIRYYETIGLILPHRDDSNGYRIYSENDVKELRLIKFLRELDVSINDIKKVKKGIITLNECLEDRIKWIEKEKNNYLLIEEMCKEIIKENKTFSTLDVTKYSRQMNILNKEGFTMKSLQTNKFKKILGAIFSTLIFDSFFIFLISLITYFQLTESEKMPLFMFIFFIFICVIPIMGTIYNLILRIKEIKKGEEDEACKY